MTQTLGSWFTGPNKNNKYINNIYNKTTVKQASKSEKNKRFM